MFGDAIKMAPVNQGVVLNEISSFEPFDQSKCQVAWYGEMNRMPRGPAHVLKLGPWRPAWDAKAKRYIWRAKINEPVPSGWLAFHCQD